MASPLHGLGISDAVFSNLWTQRRKRVPCLMPKVTRVAPSSVSVLVSRYPGSHGPLIPKHTLGPLKTGDQNRKEKRPKTGDLRCQVIKIVGVLGIP